MFCGNAKFNGRTLFSPTATVWSCVGGGVLDAPGDFAGLRFWGLDGIYGWFVGRGLDPSFAIGWLRKVARADMESAPTGNHVAVTQNCTGRRGRRPLRIILKLAFNKYGCGHCKVLWRGQDPSLRDQWVRGRRGEQCSPGEFGGSAGFLRASNARPYGHRKASLV